MPDSPPPPADFDLRLVWSFTVVAEYRHFGRAAEALHTTQPSLSRQTHRLDRMGTRPGWRTYARGMACRISELVIDAEDPGRLAAFWCDVLGYVELAREGDGSIEIGPPGVGFGGAQPTLVFNAGRNPRLGKLPLHIDVNATDRDQDAELARLLALGAVPVDIGQTGEESWHVLADPEGNEFCLLRTQLKSI